VTVRAYGWRAFVLAAIYPLRWLAWHFEEADRG
jgi:hypothetical protein